jgi:hypothetical protein
MGETGPLDRYIDALETGNAIPVYQDDNHEVYLAAYIRIAERGAALQNPDVPIAMLQLAVEEHQLYFQQQQQQVQQAGPQAPVPGVGATGQVDNQVAAQMAAGMTPEQTPQTVR